MLFELRSQSFSRSVRLGHFPHWFKFSFISNFRQKIEIFVNRCQPRLTFTNFRQILAKCLPCISYCYFEWILVIGLSEEKEEDEMKEDETRKRRSQGFWRTFSLSNFVKCWLTFGQFFKKTYTFLPSVCLKFTHNAWHISKTISK